MLFKGFRELDCYSVIDSTGTTVSLYLPKRQWDYLRWLLSQGFDLAAYTRTCDHRRQTLADRTVSLADFVSFATDRLHRLHDHCQTDCRCVVQPVFPSQIEQALDKTEAYFRRSGPDPMRWHGWTA